MEKEIGNTRQSRCNSRFELRKERALGMSTNLLKLSLVLRIPCYFGVGAHTPVSFSFSFTAMHLLPGYIIEKLDNTAPLSSGAATRR